jgi:hypothetical protein
MSQDPKQWFDQFNDLDITGNEQWCGRHWAPCPVFRANGIGATVELVRVFVDEIAGQHDPRVAYPDWLNDRMHAVGRLCCTLGDARMYEIWAHWPPSQTGT